VAVGWQQIISLSVSLYFGLAYGETMTDKKADLAGPGIGQSGTYMLLLRKAHLGEVSITVWPKILKDMCSRKNIHVLE